MHIDEIFIHLKNFISNYYLLIIVFIIFLTLIMYKQSILANMVNNFLKKILKNIVDSFFDMPYASFLLIIIALFCISKQFNWSIDEITFIFTGTTLLINILSSRYEAPLSIVWSRNKYVIYKDGIASEFFNKNKSSGIVKCDYVELINDIHPEKSIPVDKYEDIVLEYWGKSLVVSHDKLTPIYLIKDGNNGLQDIIDRIFENDVWVKAYLHSDKLSANKNIKDCHFLFVFSKSNGETFSQKYYINELLRKNIIKIPE